MSARRAETITKAGRHQAGDSLYLVVAKTGRKTWVLRYQLGGRRTDMGLGAYPAVSLSEAREKAAEARNQRAKGIDPIGERRAAQKTARPVPSFADIAGQVIEEVARKSTNDKVRYRASLLLGKSYCGKFLSRPVNSITAADIARLLNRIRAEKPETARKLHGLLAKLFETARVVLRDEHFVALGDLPTNLNDLKALGYVPVVRNEPHPALNWRHAPQFMAALRARGGTASRGS